MAKCMSTDEQNLPISHAMDPKDSSCLISANDKDISSMNSSTNKNSTADGKQETQAQNGKDKHDSSNAPPDHSKELADLRAKAKQLEELKAKTMSILFT